VSTTTAHGVARASLASKAVRALGWVVAAAWRSRFVPQDGEHPAWCCRPAEGCQGVHERGYETGSGYLNGSTWHLSAMLPIGADEEVVSPRIVGALFQREADWGLADAERTSAGSLLASLELSVDDARTFALDLLRTVREGPVNSGPGRLTWP
jgi:hypothetical protein